MLGAGVVPVGDTARAESLRLTWGKSHRPSKLGENGHTESGRCGRYMGHGIKRQGFCSRCDDKSLGKNAVDRFVF